MEDISADDFLSFSHKFKLGCLLTEQQNPKTLNLSELAEKNLDKAINVLNSLDVSTLETLQSLIPTLEGLHLAIRQCLNNNGRIFICGCGATGRLSLVLEAIWRIETKLNQKNSLNDQVISFMAGGDSALIKSVQDFEDHPEFAQQQLIQLGFKQNDLLIGSTEGGETSWVIGAVWKAASISKRKPYILYGNTDQILIKNVERSKQFILSDSIHKINCNVGQMALAGSTRMQSTTILMHAIGLALLSYLQQKSFIQYAQENVNSLLNYIKNISPADLAKMIEFQSNLYQRKMFLSYSIDQNYAITVLTDTTERSPTFSLTPFPNKYQAKEGICWCTLALQRQRSQNESDADSTQLDWKALLGDRSIRALDSNFWVKYKNKVSKEIVLGFNLNDKRQNQIKISTSPFAFQLKEDGKLFQKVIFPQIAQECLLSQHSILKMILNLVSTLIMGRMKRYESNIMTYVRPTNYKLIDRAARYVVLLRPNITYQHAVRTIFEIKNKISSDQPIVLKVIQKIQTASNNTQMK